MGWPHQEGGPTLGVSTRRAPVFATAFVPFNCALPMRAARVSHSAGAVRALQDSAGLCPSPRPPDASNLTTRYGSGWGDRAMPAAESRVSQRHHDERLRHIARWRCGRSRYQDDIAIKPCRTKEVRRPMLDPLVEPRLNLDFAKTLDFRLEPDG